MSFVQLDLGYRLVGAVVNFAAAGNANAAAVFQVSNFAQQIGTKSFIVKKIFIRDNGTGGVNVHFGVGAAGAVVDTLPTFQTVTLMDNHWQDHDIPAYQFFADMMCYPDAVGGSTLDVMVEVEEIG